MQIAWTERLLREIASMCEKAYRRGAQHAVAVNRQVLREARAVEKHILGYTGPPEKPV